MRIAEESKAVKRRQVGEGGEQAELGPPLSIEQLEKPAPMREQWEENSLT